MPNVCLLPDKDCSINRPSPNAAYNATLLYMDALYLSGVKTQQYRTLMHWTIPAEVNAAEVYKAILCLGNMAVPFGSAAAHIYRVIQEGWTEAAATWNKYDGVNVWGTAGCDLDGTDYDSTEFTAVTMPANHTRWFEVDITAMVTDAITNHSRSLNLIFRLDDENPGTSIQFYWKSKDNAIDTWTRPYLNIVRPPFGMPVEV